MGENATVVPPPGRCRLIYGETLPPFFLFVFIPPHDSFVFLHVYAFYPPLETGPSPTTI